MKIHVSVKTSYEGLLIDYIEGILSNGTEIVFDCERSNYAETTNGFIATLLDVTINGTFPKKMPADMDSLVVTNVHFSDGSRELQDLPATVEKMIICHDSQTLILNGPLYFTGTSMNGKVGGKA